MEAVGGWVWIFSGITHSQFTVHFLSYFCDDYKSKCNMEVSLYSSTPDRGFAFGIFLSFNVSSLGW